MVFKFFKMAFYIRICDGNRGIDIKSYKLPYIVFVSEKSMLDTLDDCYDFIVNATEDATINIFEKELMKRRCIGACYRLCLGNLSLVIMTNDKFNKVTIQKLIVILKNQYGSGMGQKELDDFLKDNQEYIPDKLELIQNNLDEIKGIMVQNIDDVIKRGERLCLIHYL